MHKVRVSVIKAVILHGRLGRVGQITVNISTDTLMCLLTHRKSEYLIYLVLKNENNKQNL
jgi:hypothetical protein